MLLTVCLYVHLLHRVNMRAMQVKCQSVSDYLYSLARATGRSEFDIFHASAEDWPVSKPMIDKDFKTYLIEGITPYYVNDFVRRNKKHIDELLQLAAH